MWSQTVYSLCICMCVSSKSLCAFDLLIIMTQAACKWCLCAANMILIAYENVHIPPLCVWSWVFSFWKLNTLAGFTSFISLVSNCFCGLWTRFKRTKTQNKPKIKTCCAYVWVCVDVFVLKQHEMVWLMISVF